MSYAAFDAIKIGIASPEQILAWSYAVSYTHLDVYKRQLQSGAPAGMKDLVQIGADADICIVRHQGQ